MGNDDTPVDHDRPTGLEFGPPIIERLMTGTELRVSRSADAEGKPAIVCETQGEMSLQGSAAAHGRDSTPQQLLRLVGCRDPKAPAKTHSKTHSKAHSNAGLNPAADSWRRPQRNGGA